MSLLPSGFKTSSTIENIGAVSLTLRRFQTFARFLFVALLVFIAQTVNAQEKQVTLVLKGGEELPCTVTDIWQGEVYFEAVSARDAYKYGEAISLEKIEYVRLNRNRVMKPQEFAAHWRGETVPQEEPTKTPEPKSQPVVAQPAATPPPPRESGPGLRLQSLNIDTTRNKGGIGLRYPEMPRTESAPAMEYSEVADLLAESGLAGKLLYEIGAGELRRRQLTNSQKRMVDALLQSRAWSLRKRDLRSAHLRASGEFERVAQSQSRSDELFESFRYRPADSQYAFLEFAQFLHAENAHKFLDKWQKVENLFSAEGASALRDLLNNYDDWYYLYGQEVEKRSEQDKLR